jgi:hypothetical protein
LTAPCFLLYNQGLSLPFQKYYNYPRAFGRREKLKYIVTFTAHDNVQARHSKPFGGERQPVLAGRNFRQLK